MCADEKKKCDKNDLKREYPSQGTKSMWVIKNPTFCPHSWGEDTKPGNLHHTLKPYPQGYWIPLIPQRTLTLTHKKPHPCWRVRVLEGKGAGRKKIPGGYPCQSLTTWSWMIQCVWAPVSFLLHLLLKLLPPHLLLSIHPVLLSSQSLFLKTRRTTRALTLTISRDSIKIPGWPM